MKCIKENVSNEIIIKNSKFICFLYKINSVDDVINYLDKIKIEEKDATHYCYAYIIDNIKKSSDDGEPSNTAGMPILNVLENNNLSNILAIVVRYFGGVKLGAGGLIRAYTKSVTNTISKDNIIELIDGYNIDVVFNYEDTKDIDYLFRNVDIKKKDFSINITYNIDIPDGYINIMDINNINYKINKKILIEDTKNIDKI